MKEEDLIKSRQVWEVMFLAEPPYTLNWNDWADDTILKCEIPPIWLIDLSLAKEKHEALHAIQESIGIDISKLNDPLDHDLLILGTIYSFWPKATSELNDLWQRFNEVTDLAQFLENHSPLQRVNASPITKETYLENTEFIFKPLAQYAYSAFATYIGVKYVNA